MFLGIVNGYEFVDEFGCFGFFREYWDDIGGSSTWNTNSGTSYMFNGATITGDLSAVGLTCIKESNTLDFAFSGINVTGK